ncbi:tripartite tricarboxylate transporter substrate binding protein [Ramlibacter sp. AN1133]|uniref:tripartite tricarboxylate transporter substrate binding protein n=1 Tax=Ramlibacter sp. AN1133 TaxID=3133429 RepID=UPI0030C4A4EA
MDDEHRRAALRRRTVLGACASLVACPALALAQPAAWPARPITLIVPWPAGGQTDITMRILADLAGKQLGQSIVIDNKPGAAGTLVGPALRAAAPDGYTIGQLPLTLYRAPLQRKVPWDPLRDITPVIQISGVTFGIVVPADSPFQTFGEMVTWGREHPGSLTVGSTGIGSTAHLAMEDVLSREGVTYIHVPYKGTADQMLAVATKTLMVGVNSTGFAPYVETGKLRLLATFNAQRSKRWPQVPTLRELGHPQAVYTSPYGIGAPAAVDRAIIRRLHDAFRTALFDPVHLQEIAKYDQEPEYLNTADYGRFVQDVTARERQLLARLGIVPSHAE